MLLVDSDEAPACAQETPRKQECAPECKANQLSDEENRTTALLEEYDAFLRRTRPLKPLYVVVGAGSFVLGCFLPTMWRYLLHSIAGMLVMRVLEMTAYTQLSWALLFYTVIEAASFPSQHHAMVPFMLVNFVGLNASFQVSILLDKTSFSRLAAVCKWTMTQFHIINFVSHVLPVFVMAGLIFRDPQAYMDSLEPVGIHVGWCTAIFHLTWAFLTVGGLDLSVLYVPFEKSQWYTMWAVSVVVHVLTGVLLYTVVNKDT
jgi:hypothetical protein